MAETRTIQILSDHVINKIAAGEVVERPASVAKELVENALDAGASNVEVEVVDGGRKVIRVADDGGGMDRDNALMSIERHATSKIRDVDDIEAIHTLGFRGEALAAIAAVSRFTLATRPADALGGTEIHLAGGRLLEVVDAGGPPGTQITVKNLFFNVPARRKFLRSEQAEMGHVRQMFLLYALSHPQVGLRLIADGRELYNLPGGATLDERLRELFGETLTAALRPVSAEGDGMRLTGRAGVPSASRSDRSAQYTFINGRPASAPLFAFALSEAYRDLLPKGRHPAAFLFLDIEPDLVDVNVHPTKKEVRFRRSGEVRDLILEGLRAALRDPGRAPAADPAPGGTAADAPVPAPPAAWNAPELKIDDLPAAQSFVYPRMSLPGSEPPAGGDAASGTPVYSEATAPEAPGGRSPWTWCRVLGQVGGAFVAMETEDGLVLMDPRAAHERVLYDRWMRQVAAHQVRGQGLLMPETVALSPRDHAAVVRHMPVLRGMGFGLSEFGGTTVMVDAVPACLGEFKVADMLAEVAQDVEQAGAGRGAGRLSEELVARAACRAAVRARDRLSLGEIQTLVRDLAACEMPYTCPHGRPTLIYMSLRELKRKFGRT